MRAAALLSAKPQPILGGRVVFLGDSLVQGYGVSAGQMFPDQAIAALTTSLGSLLHLDAWYNSGIGGNTIGQMLDRYSADVDAHRRSGATVRLVRGGYGNVMLLYGGTNDCNQAVPRDLIEYRWRTLLRTARASGWRTVACTLADDQYPSNPGTFAADRAWFNALVTANGYEYDKLFDVAAIPQLQDATNTTYFQADKTHWTAAGHAIAGAAAATVLSQVMR